MKGIDVSKHQGVIDWIKLKNTNPDIKFVLIRAGYGMYNTQVDIKFHDNIKGAIQVGLPLGIYWYSYATTISEAKKEATICINTIEQYRNSISFPVFFDQEYEPSITALSKQVRTDICIAFMEEIKKAGYLTGLYCSYDWIQNWVYKDQLKQYDKWIAQYGSTCSYNDSDLAIWQYSSKGKVSGINGNVDMNIAYKNYGQSSPIQAGWKKDSKGWWYQKADGNYPAGVWNKIDDKWYWFNKEGYAVKGYQTIDGKKYYFAEQYALGEIKECQLLMTDESGALL